VFFWIPAFAGMTAFSMINVAVYNQCKMKNGQWPTINFFFDFSLVIEN
jgi:hypothetical protein